MPRIQYFYLSDTLFEIGWQGSTPLRLALTQAAITSGTVTIDIFNREETPPTQIGTQIALSHHGTPDGHWYCYIDDDFNAALVPGLQVLVKLNVDDGSRKGYWELDGVVEVQKGDTRP